MSEFQTVSESELQSVEGGWLIVLGILAFTALTLAAAAYVEPKDGSAVPKECSC